MKQTCMLCSRTAPGGNLWCQEADCAAALKPDVFEYGEALADLNIDKLEVVLPTGVIYRATRENGEAVLLKIAHVGFEERLKQECRLLADLQHNKVEHPALPHLLPPYTQAGLDAFQYGKTMHQGVTYYYAVYEQFDGEPLRSWLLKNPQPWYQHVGWLMIGLSSALDVMHQRNLLHATLTPDSILLRFDRERVPRPVLADLGLVADHQTIATIWQPAYCPPAYTPPELMQTSVRKLGRRTDVYGLGLILYEMLAGTPAYPYRLRTVSDIQQRVLNGQREPLNRSELKGVPDIAAQAISLHYDARPETAGKFAAQLLAVFPPVPRERKPRQFNWRVFAVVMIALFLISILLATAVSLAEPIA